MSLNNFDNGFMTEKSMPMERIFSFFFHLTIISSFLGSDILSLETPIGAIFPFRVLLPLTILLFFAERIEYGLRINKNRKIRKLNVYGIIFAFALLAYGFASLFFAIDKSYTFKRLFNLSFDMGLFLLCLFYVSNHKKLKALVYNLTACSLLTLFLGVYEVFDGNILFSEKYVRLARYSFFDRAILKPAAVTFTNTNDLNAGIFMITAAVSCYYIYGILKSKNKRIKTAYSAILLLLFVPTAFLIECSGARLVKISLYIVLAFMTGLFVAYSKKHLVIPAAIFIVSIFFSYAGDYYNINARTINMTNDAVYFVLDEAHNIAPSLVKKPTKKEHIPLREKLSIKDEMFAKDENGEMILNTKYSGGIRLALIKSGFKMFSSSNGLGVGLGNGEMLLKQHKDRTGGITNFHCYVVRLIAEYGVFALIPALILVLSALRSVFGSFKTALERRDSLLVINIVSVIGAALIFPFVSTAPSDAQDILQMWVYASIILSMISFWDEGDIMGIYSDKDQFNY